MVTKTKGAKGKGQHLDSIFLCEVCNMQSMISGGPTRARCRTCKRPMRLVNVVKWP
jgi:hypothetical protein